MINLKVISSTCPAIEKTATFAAEVTNECHVNSKSKASAKAQLNIFPNPAHDYITLVLGDGHDYSTIVIYDALMRPVDEVSFHESNNQLSIAGIPEGLYMVKVGNSFQSLVIQR
ncbi:MAG TPA: T9SS type A sorting domain-containing protein [Cytophagaceae bacterium]|jgi:hypothetical protein